MANMTVRINIHGMCRSKELWTGSVSAGEYLEEPGDALEGIKPSTWSERASSNEERSFKVFEGSTWRNIPAITFNILQAAEARPDAVREIVHEEAPDVAEEFSLDEKSAGEREFYIELVDALAYLSVERYDDYAERYWFHPWQKAKERNPDLLGEGRRVLHPGKDAEKEEEMRQSENVTSAADAGW